jgi:hypothetical protein
MGVRGKAPYRSRFRFLGPPNGLRRAFDDIVDHMTFIIEAVKDNHHTFDIRSSAVVAVVLALKLVADGFEVAIRTPSGHVYNADRFNLLLTGTNSDSQGMVEDG